MQNPQACQDLVGLCGALARAANQTLPEPLRSTAADPATLGELWTWLHHLNQVLGNADRRLLLAIDEYENLDRKIAEGVFPIDLLSGLRESLQSHRRIVWLFAGSHAIEELSAAPWASSFVSVRTVKVGMFTPEETSVLLTDPLRHAPRARLTDASGVHFSHDFWGPDGIQRIHQQAGGWPHLVQLIAQALVDLVNCKGKGEVAQPLFEEALDKAIVLGHVVFFELMHKECRFQAEWEYLAGFRTQDTQPAPSEEVLSALRCRLLVEPDGDYWRLRVPLMQRWLRARG